MAFTFQVEIENRDYAELLPARPNASGTLHVMPMQPHQSRALVKVFAVSKRTRELLHTFDVRDLPADREQPVAMHLTGKVLSGSRLRLRLHVDGVLRGEELLPVRRYTVAPLLRRLAVVVLLLLLLLWPVHRWLGRLMEQPPEATVEPAEPAVEPVEPAVEPVEPADPSPAARDRPETTPAQPETTPAQPERTPAQPETTPAQPETAPAESETAPAESETAPAEPETTPAQPETAPAQPERTLAEPETTPAQPETTPAQPETTPARPDPPVRTDSIDASDPDGERPVTDSDRVQPAGIVYFLPESAQLRSSALATIEQVAAELRASDARVDVIGHTAFAGTSEGRRRLSIARAEAVAEQLQRDGVPESRIRNVGGRGAEEAVSDDEKRQDLDRRVEIVPIEEQR